MRVGDVGEGAVVVERAVGHQRRLAAEVAPQLQLRVAGAGGGHHLLVVAAEGHEAVRLGEPREAVQDAGRVEAVVDVIAQCHDRLVARRRHRLEQRLQRGRAAVDIADGEDAGRGSHTRGLIGPG